MLLYYYHYDDDDDDDLHRPLSLTTTTTRRHAGAAAALVEPASKLLIAAGAAVGASVGSLFLRNHGTKQMLDRIDAAFPGSLTNDELIQRVTDRLKSSHQLDASNTLLCTSFCRDELARGLERDLSKAFGGRHYTMGGLAGFPFGGITAFESMVSHIPLPKKDHSGSAALIVFAPQVGVDAAGHLGTVNRQGRDESTAGPCSQAAMAALKYVTTQGAKKVSVTSAQDAEYVLLCNALLPYAERLDQSEEPMVDLSYCLYDAQKEMMTNIVKKACASIPQGSKVGLLGGVQINTPAGTTDYFIPLSFELYDNTGTMVDDLTL